MNLQLLILGITSIVPIIALADALFSNDSLVKMLDPNSFKSALEPNVTSMVAFVSSSDPVCQRMVPHYNSAALGLHPYLRVYAIDCDEEINKDLCKEEQSDHFPIIKLFPRGKSLPSLTFKTDDEASASAFYYWASRGIPNHVTKHYRVEEIRSWIKNTKDKNAVLLLTKDKKVPLLWKVLANKYAGQLELASHRDRKGKSSVIFGMEAGGKKDAKVLVYPVGSINPVRYEGINKLDSLSRFFDSILDGSANLGKANEKARAEEFVPDEKELEIERKQEAQRLALAHGGFSDFIDFEKAIKEGHGADYHDIHGYPGMMGEQPKVRKQDVDDSNQAFTASESNRHVDEL